MNELRKNWVSNTLTAIGMLFLFGVAWTASSNESAVRGEQIRTIQDDARSLHDDGEKHEARIRATELETNGLKGAVEAVRVIAAENAKSLNILLGRGH